MFRAGRDGEWSVVEDVALRTNRRQRAAQVAAECGNLDLVRSRLLMCSALERIDLIKAACAGGQLQAMQLCCEAGVGVNDAQPDSIIE